MLLARTDPDEPKRKGITYFLIDLRQPGVDVRALRHIGGEVDFNEVFLDGARVPDTQRVGEVGDGWKVANATLSGERQMVSGEGSGGVDRIGGSGVERLIRRAQERTAAGRTGGWDEPLRRQELMRLYSEETHPGLDQPAGAGQPQGRPVAGARELDRQGAPGRAEPADPAARRRPVRSRGVGMGAVGGPVERRLRRLAHLRGERHAPQPGQHDRGRHDRGEQEHPRGAGARPAP